MNIIVKLMNKINWNKIKNTEILIDITNCLLIFKHSPRCIISRIVLERFENDYKKGDLNLEFIMVDVISEKLISNKIAEIFKIRHESPQVILIKNNKVILCESHESITYKSIKDVL